MILKKFFVIFSLKSTPKSELNSNNEKNTSHYPLEKRLGQLSFTKRFVNALIPNNKLDF